MIRHFKMKLFLVILLVGLANSCYVAPDRANGLPLQREDFTSQVYLETFYSFENKQVCTGNLISDRFILTSASCVFGAFFVNVHLSAFDLRNPFESNRVIFKTDNIHVKPGYFATTNENNIALVELPSALTLTAKAYTTARLPLRSNSFVENLIDGWSIGWGTEFESYKQEIDGKISTKTACEAAYPQIPTTASGQFCVQRETSAINCVGGLSSSFFVGIGSPAEYTLLGFHSLTSDATCATGTPALFTDITSHLDWIASETGIIFE